MNSPVDSEDGSYRAVRLPLADMERHDVRPRELALSVVRGEADGSRVLRIVG